MPLQPPMNDTIRDIDWPDLRRPEAWAGELRVNLVRLVAMALFYARHLMEFYLASADSPVRGAYHARVTIIVIAWAGAAVLLHVMLARSRRMPEGLGYLTVALDAMMVTLLCAVGGGPRTPLVLLYFLLIAGAPLRLSLGVVYAATAGAMLGYLFLLGYYAWYVIGFHTYYATPQLRIPRSEEAIILLALLVAGLFAGQSVRQSRRLAEGPHVTVDRSKAPASAASPPIGEER